MTYKKRNDLVTIPGIAAKLELKIINLEKYKDHLIILKRAGLKQCQDNRRSSFHRPTDSIKFPDAF